MEKINKTKIFIIKPSRYLKYYILPFIAFSMIGLSAQNAKPAPPEAPSAANKKYTFLDGLEFEGQIRFRPELRENTDFNKTTDDKKDYTGQKVQFGMTKTFNQNIKAKILFQDARVWGGEKGAEHGANTAVSGQTTDIREAWVEYKTSDGFSAQAGRQTLVYGDQRLLGALEWSTTGRSFDGIRLKYESDMFKSHVFGMVLGEKDSDVGLNVTNAKLQDAYLTGWYNTLKLNEHFQAEGYYFGKYQRFIPKTNPVSVAPGALITTQDRDVQRDLLHTFGARLTNRTTDKGKSTTEFDWTTEYIVQRGTNGKYVNASWDTAQVIMPIDPFLFNSTNNPCRTSMTKGGCRVYTEKQQYDTHAFAAKAGYTLMKKIRIGGEYNVGSGDPNRTDSTVGTFQNLFGTNHAHYGQSDTVSFSNMIGRSADITLFFEKYGSIVFAVWDFRKNKLQDAWYNVNGVANAAQSTESASNNKYKDSAFLQAAIAREFDVTYNVDFGNLNWNVGYSTTIAGKSITNSMDDIAYNYFVLKKPGVTQYKADPRYDFLYVMMTYKF